jgi:hypothetical protein
MLDAGWPGLFREHILPSIPVNKISKYFDATFGRPTKELYSMLGALTKKPCSNMPLIFNGIIHSICVKRPMMPNIFH